MKIYVNKYQDFINESEEVSSFLTDFDEIEEWLDLHNITKYTINEDSSVDVNGDVKLIRQKIQQLPLKFRMVTGEFDCSLNRLTSLKGCPNYVNGNFLCSFQNISSLEYCPKVVNGGFYCNDCNLTSLVFSPKLPQWYTENPCGMIYNGLGFTTEAHVEALITLDPNPKETLEKLKVQFPDRYNDILKVSKELRIIMGLESEELTNAYNTSKNVEGDFY